MRARSLRRVHGHPRRPAGALLPDAGGPGRRQRRDHDRGAGPGRGDGRPAASHVGFAQLPVRFLHAGDGDAGRRDPQRPSGRGRAGDPRGAVRQHLPVHRLPEHHRRRPAGRRANPRGAIMTAIAAERYTGASITRSEDPRILTGAGRYVDDIKLPGMLHAAFVRSPMAHARVLSVDVSAARELPGVVAAYTGAELEAMTVPGPDALMALMGWQGPTPQFTLLATDKVRFAGDPVAFVIAEARYLAEDGCELVAVDYEDLQPVVNASFALDPASPPLFANLGDNIASPQTRHEFGDVAATFAGADRVYDFHVDVHRHQNVPMEGRACVASYDADSGVMTMYAATQSVHVSKIAVAMRLGMEQDKVRALAGDIGGSFGLKIGASREELAVAAASRDLGRPVKWTEDRGETLMASGHAREESCDVRAAVSKDGGLLGLDVAMVIDIGAYPVMGTMVPGIVEGMLPGPYKMAALGFESTAVATNKASYIAYRGPWASETFVRERVIDLLARDLGLDPLEIRLRNAAPRTDPPVMLGTGRPLAGITTRESLERVAQMVDIPAFRRRQVEERLRG